MYTTPPEQASTCLSKPKESCRQTPFLSVAVGEKQGAEYCIFTDIKTANSQTKRMGLLLFFLLHSWRLLNHLKLKEGKKKQES